MGTKYPAHMAPRDHRIHLGRTDSPESSPQNHSSAKICFSGPKKTYAGQNVDLGGPKSDPRFQNPPPGMKKQKMRAKQPCRTPPSKNQMEPYSASYGRKPFWGVPALGAIWELLGGRYRFAGRIIQIMCVLLSKVARPSCLPARERCDMHNVL